MDNPPKTNLVPLVEAFDMIGRSQSPEWDGNEAKAIRVGQRSTDPAAWERGRAAEKIMRMWLENGWLSLVYTDQEGHRVRYPEQFSHWVTTIYPQPADDSSGMIELASGAIYPAVADVRELRRLISRSFTRPVKRGPKRMYAEYRTSVEEFFASHHLEATHDDVRAFIKAKHLSDDQWPRKSQENAIILEVRTRLKNDRMNAGRPPVGTL
ncbi:hypothetical protein [Phenylobacterium sp.]|uniref:hypothetical protein n=1 Tax=Phenylobacterium sp. TaxID=1871053 RepID=UPI0030F484FE